MGVESSNSYDKYEQVLQQEKNLSSDQETINAVALAKEQSKALKLQTIQDYFDKLKDQPEKQEAQLKEF